MVVVVYVAVIAAILVVVEEVIFGVVFVAFVTVIIFHISHVTCQYVRSKKWLSGSVEENGEQRKCRCDFCNSVSGPKGVISKGVIRRTSKHLCTFIYCSSSLPLVTGY